MRRTYFLLLFFVFPARDDCEVAERFGAGAEVLMPVGSAWNTAERSRAVLGAVRRAGLDRRLVFLQVPRLRPDVVSGALEDDEDRLVAVLVRVGLRPDELADVHVGMRPVADGRHHVEECGAIGARLAHRDG